MKRIKIKQVDVFTQKPFQGNPAGVVTEADGLNLREMQKIAKEMGLSETVFVFSSTSEKADFRARFFTPKTELDLAGHPTLAAFHSLSEEARFFLREPVTTVNQQTGAGILPIELYVEKGEVKKIMMTQAKPTYRPFAHSLEELAELLRTDLGEITSTNLPVEFVSTGLEVLIVPFKNLSAVQTIKPDFPNLSWNIFLFTQETLSPLFMVHTRFFAPKLGVSEDPATGTATGALGAYLVKNKIIRGNSPLTFLSEQGHELGRPSEITTEVHFSNGKVETVKIGGTSVTVMEGEMIF